MIATTPKLFTAMSLPSIGTSTLPTAAALPRWIPHWPRALSAAFVREEKMLIAFVAQTMIAWAAAAKSWANNLAWWVGTAIVWSRIFLARLMPIPTILPV